MSDWCKCRHHVQFHAKYQWRLCIGYSADGEKSCDCAGFEDDGDEGYV